MTARDRLRQRFPTVAARLDSREDHTAEADPSGAAAGGDGLLERWVAGLELRKGLALAVFGLGDGSHLSRLLQALPSGCFVFCGEPDLRVVERFCGSPDAEPLLSDGRFFLGAGVCDELFFEAMGRFPVLEVTSAQPVIFAPLFWKDEAAGAVFFREFARQLDYWRTLFGTNLVSSGKWQGNTLANLPLLFDAPDLGALTGAFEGRTMVLASAGPSLDESLDFIRRSRDRAVVVAVNSSYRALRNAGIAPHFVIAADPYGDTAKGFAGVETAETVLVCPFLVCPEVVPMFAGRIVTWSAGNLLASYLRLKTGLPLGANVVEQGTVSACAFDLARIFGCRELVLTGQDLAILESGRSHAVDSFYTDANANRADVAKCRRFPGNTFETVLVEEKLHVYLKTFQQLVRDNASWLRVVNTSRLGARIDGAPYVALDAVDLSSAPSDIEALWRDTLGRAVRGEPRWERGRTELERLRDYARAACSQALRIALALEVEEGGAIPRATLEECLRRRDALADQLDSSPDYWRILSEGSLKYELARHVREVQELDPSAGRGESAAAELRSYCWAVAEGAFQFLADSEAACDGERVPAPSRS